MTKTGLDSFSPFRAQSKCYLLCEGLLDHSDTRQLTAFLVFSDHLVHHFCCNTCCSVSQLFMGIFSPAQCMITLSLTRDWTFIITVSSVLGTEEGVQVYWLLYWFKKPKVKFQVPWLVRNGNTFVQGDFWVFKWSSFRNILDDLYLNDLGAVWESCRKQSAAWFTTETSLMLLDVPAQILACSSSVK